jgi:hypothetical protein
MDNISNEEFFAAIFSSNILAPYLQQDSDLAELLRNPNNSDIHYPQSYVPAKEINHITQSRIDIYISIGHEDEPVIESAKQLVAFCKKYDNAQMYAVSFNCSEHNYIVWCGVVESQIHVICVMTGGYIPDDAFGE